MHLQQTKRDSRHSGGPQYYFHDLSEVVKTYLRKKGAVPVALVTPYGATRSQYFAVSADRKLGPEGMPVPGKVGHDRIQGGSAGESIGESIRRWYCMPVGDYERIDVDIQTRDDVFYLLPVQCKYAGAGKARTVSSVHKPLTFTGDYISPFWKEHLLDISKGRPELLRWSVSEICRIVADHRPEIHLPRVLEPDLLRASGPLRHLGVTFGGYVGKGYDCWTEFQFLKYPAYSVPVEIKRRSSGFQYQQQKYGREELSRAVVLCAIHDHRFCARSTTTGRCPSTST